MSTFILNGPNYSALENSEKKIKNGARPTAVMLAVGGLRLEAKNSEIVDFASNLKRLVGP